MEFGLNSEALIWAEGGVKRNICYYRPKSLTPQIIVLIHLDHVGLDNFTIKLIVVQIAWIHQSESLRAS